MDRDRAFGTTLDLVVVGAGGGPEKERRRGRGGEPGAETLKEAGERRRSRSPAKGISAINDRLRRLRPVLAY